MASQDGKSRFWGELDGRLARLEKSEAWLARRLNLPVQTVASWKQRNQFRRACLLQLGEVLHWEGLDEESAARARRRTHRREGSGEGRHSSHRGHAPPDQPRVSCRRKGLHTLCRPLGAIVADAWRGLLLCLLRARPIHRTSSRTPRMATDRPGRDCAGNLPGGTLPLHSSQRGRGFVLSRHLGFRRAGLSESCGGRDRRLPCSAHELDGPGRSGGPAENRARSRRIESFAKGWINATSRARRCGCRERSWR